MKLNVAVATLSASTVKAWTGTTPGEAVQDASSNFPTLYYLGKGYAVSSGGDYFVQPPATTNTEAKCATACETGKAYNRDTIGTTDSSGNQIPYPGSLVTYPKADLQAFEFYSGGTPNSGATYTECWCLVGADEKVNGKDYTADASGVGQCRTFLEPLPNNPYGSLSTSNMSCDNWKVFCYGCLRDLERGGELAPSNQPSGIPSQSPSGMPSQSPSGQPSGQPSSLPSCTPSAGPTPSPSINLFYPDQTQAGFETGCLNDGQQPAWMEANPTNWLYSTLDKCCTQHFSWNYDFCMGMLDDTCARALWYPDWEKANKGCVRDGEEPLYMTANSAIYLYNTKADCCEEHYSWDYATCMGGATGSTSGTKWYADWETGDDTCKNDGNAPDYMIATSVNWLYADKEDCCSRFFSYSLADCMGTYTSSNGSGKYYPDWAGDNEGCLVDSGSTPAPTYMRATEAWFYDTLDKCCAKHYAHNLSGCKGQAATASATAYTGNEKWYLSWSSGKCVQDCAAKTGTKCGGLADSWDIKYDTQDKCCKERSWWNIKQCKA